MVHAAFEELLLSRSKFVSMHNPLSMFGKARTGICIVTIVMAVFVESVSPFSYCVVGPVVAVANSKVIFIAQRC